MVLLRALIFFEPFIFGVRYTMKECRAIEAWNHAMSARQRRFIDGLKSPDKIQEFIDSLAYSCVDTYRSPQQVLVERTGHCFDGAVFAAAVLRRLGKPALLLDMIPNGRDDDHVLALFRRNGCWGAIAKSNFVGLRFREPVYRTPRELVMSYFEHFFNAAREKTLAGYTRPIHLRGFDHVAWMTDGKHMDAIAEQLDATRRYKLLTPKMARDLSEVDPLTFRAGMLVAKKEGLFKV